MNPVSCLTCGFAGRIYLALLGFTLATASNFGQTSDPTLPLLPLLVDQPEKAHKPFAPELVVEVPPFTAQEVKLPEKKETPSESMPALIDAYLTQGKSLRTEMEKSRYQEVKGILLTQLGNAITESWGKARREKSYTELFAIIMLIAELADKEYDKVGNRLSTDDTEKLTRALANKIIPLADPKQEDDWKIRYVALRTLGKITPPAESAIPVVRANLQLTRAPVELRRAAAYALVDMARYLGEDFYLPIDKIKTCALVAGAARIGLHDSDETVRGYCLLAIIESAHTLNTQILPQLSPVAPNQNLEMKFEEKKVNLQGKILIFDLAHKEFRTSFVELFLQYQTLNKELLEGLHDRSSKIQLTSLEAIESILNARVIFVNYLRWKTTNAIDTPGSILRKAGFVDPLGQIIENRGRAIAGLIMRSHEIKLRRMSMVLLEQLGDELYLVEAGSVLEPLTAVLRNNGEDVFVRWSVLNMLERLIRSEQNSDRSRNVLKSLLDQKMSIVLSQILTDADPELSKDLHPGQRLHHGVAMIPYPDPDLSKRALSTLEALGSMTNTFGTREEKQQVASVITTLVDHIFVLRNGIASYDFGARYDIDTKKAALKALGSMHGEHVVAGMDTITLALDMVNEPDARLRRAAVDALGRYASFHQQLSPALENTLRTKALPALQRALQRDDDPEVRMNASATIVLISGLKQKR